MIDLMILDDNCSDLDQILECIDTYQKERNRDLFQVHSYTNEDHFLREVLNVPKPCIYILDVLLPKHNGIQIGELIRKEDEHFSIIYTTSSSEYAIPSFRVRPLDYLLKPLKQADLNQALDDACKVHKQVYECNFPVKTKEGIRLLPYSELTHIECKSHHSFYYLKDHSVIKSITTRQSFDVVNALLLEDERFLKISASYIVNLMYIKHLDHSSLMLQDGTKLSISRTHYSHCKKTYMKHLFAPYDSKGEQ